MAIEAGEIHVWRSVLDFRAAWFDRFLATLDRHEIERSRSYVFARDRSRFAVRRGVLRTILAAYVNLSPRDVALSCAPCGKPLLVGPSRGGDCLDFSVSSSGDLALYAVGRQARVGIDAEAVGAGPPPLDAVEPLLTARELKVLQSADRTERHRLFLALWTRKEAYVKACGIGLARPPCEIDVPSEWRIDHFVPAEGYIAAVAVKAACVQVKYFDWVPELLS